MTKNFATLDASTNFEIREGFCRALDFCGAKIKTDRSEVIRLLQRGNKAAHSNFRYGLAKKIGEYLGSFSNNLSEIYIHGSAAKNSSGPGSDIDIILLLENKLDPFQLLLFKLNDEVEFYYNELMQSNYFKGDFSPFLDIKLVDREEIELNRGFGTVINSLHYRPIKIWCNKDN